MPDDVPDYQSLMLPVLKVGAAGEIHVRDCVERIADELGLTEEQRTELLPSGRQTKFANRVHWAKTYLKHAGLLEITRRGYFRATQRGLDVLDENLESIDNRYLQQFESFREFRDRSQPKRSSAKATQDQAPEDYDQATPEERIEAVHEEITSELRQDLLDRIVGSSPEFFERLVVDLMEAMGYGGSLSRPGKALGRSGDGGIDGVINEDTLGLDSVYLQAKRYSPGNTVGIEKIREFAGSLAERGASKGVFVTTSSFASRAWDYVERIPQTVVLIDGERLSRLLVTYDVGVRTTQKLELKRLDLDYFDQLDGE